MTTHKCSACLNVTCKMSSSCFRQSLRYIWSTEKVLGSGATATVYQGENKEDGTPVAVKKFHQVTSPKAISVQFRELEVLKKVNHENIVKLIAIEDEKEKMDKVVIMELCTGGTLLNVLQNPDNKYGLEEKEFMLVMKHLYHGMKYLRDNDLVHRDLKPGNIMKFVKDDGTTVYKIADFGAARELQDHQHFQSLYGTEEYLRPDMYERLWLRKNDQKSFDATTDLWSIGVTLYHVATGNLPFKPYGGRRNRQTMLHIISKKEKGVISGIQFQRNGPIEWSTELPNTCRLSVGLKKILTPILAGLLDPDCNSMWSFDRYFSEVGTLLSKESIDIFYVNKAELMKVYINPNEMYINLQQYIKEQTNMPPERQMLLLKTTLLESIVEKNTFACGYPKTTEEEPLFLFDKENHNITITSESDLPKFKDFDNFMSIVNDTAHAKTLCIIGSLYKTRTEKLSILCKLIWDTVENYTKYINKELKNLHLKSQHLTEKTTLMKTNAELLEIIENSTKSDVKNLWESSKYCQTGTHVQRLYECHCVENILKEQWGRISKDLKCPSKTLALARLSTLVDHLRSSWQTLHRYQSMRILPIDYQEAYVREKTKIMCTVNQIKDLWEKDIILHSRQLVEQFGDWFKMAQTTDLQIGVLITDVDKYEEKLKELNDKLSVENLGVIISMKLCKGMNTLTNHLSKWEEFTKLMSEHNNLIQKIDDRIADLYKTLEKCVIIND